MTSNRQNVDVVFVVAGLVSIHSVKIQNGCVGFENVTGASIGVQ